MKFNKLNLLLLSTLVLYTACSDEKQIQRPKELPVLRVNIITVKKEAVPIWKQYTGTTKASSDQEVRARVSGVLRKIYFKDGTIVKKGQKLFMIDQAEYIAARDAARAQKAQDEASLALAEADVKRYEPLVATLEQYQAQRASLKAAIAGDTARIRQTQLELGYTMVRAPISGRVSARRVDIGNLVGQGEATLLTTIMKIDPIYAYFSPSQNDVRMFQKYKNEERSDAFIEIQGSMGTIRLNGYVDFSNNTVDSLTSTISMRAIPGTFVYVNIFINDKYKFLMIPPEVVFNDQLGSFVYIVDENNKIKRVDIQTGYSSKYYISVKSGLKDGDKLIVSSLVKLKTGRSVIATDVSDTQGIKAVLSKKNLIPQSN